MSRYQSTNIKTYITDKTKISNFKNANPISPEIRETTIFTSTERTNSDYYITSKITDRLDLLAYKYYGDTSLWWIIAIANNIGKGSLFIEPGIQIRIPSDIQSFKNALKDNQL